VLFSVAKAMRKVLLLVPFLVVLVLLLPEERRTVRPAHDGAPPAPTRRGYPLRAMVTAPAATEAASKPAPVASTAVSRAKVAVSEAVAREVEPVARELHVDDETRDRIAELTQRSFDELMAEIEARALSGSTAESQDEIVARKQRELHGRILDVLNPAQQARYRELVGLEAP
jgi:hypothetical protein